MSLVIAMIDKDLKKLYFYGDKRRTTRNVDGTSITSDDYTKIFKLKDDLFIGFTGIAEVGNQVLLTLNDLSNRRNDEIIYFATQINVPLIDTPEGPKGAFVTIAGKNNNGELFIWTRSNNDSPKYQVGKKQGDVNYSIASPTDDLLYENTLLRYCFINNFLNLNVCIEAAIVKISESDDTISPIFDSFHLEI